MEKIIGGKWQRQRRRRRNLRQLANGERFECTHFVRKYTYARTGRCLSRLIWPSHKDTLTSKTKSSKLEPLKNTVLTKKCFCLFLSEEAWSHGGGLQTRELGQTPSHVSMGD